MKPRLLLVDDDAKILSGLRRQLHSRYAVTVAEGGEAGLAAIAEQGPFAVVVSDMRMPGMDGATFLARVRVAAPLTTRVLLTGQTEPAAAIRAINDGQVFRFLNKPCPPETLDRCLQEAVVRYEAARDEESALAAVLADRRVLDHALDPTVPAGDALAAELLDALRNGEFHLRYQPIVALADERVIGVEALMRWTPAHTGLVTAAHFIPAAEATGLIRPLGRWVMSAACQEVASWPALSVTESLRVHINLSEGQLRDPQLAHDLQQALTLSGFDPRRVTLEIDHGPALSERQPLASLRTLCNRGMELALCGFTDAALLRDTAERLPLAVAKIRRHLTALLPTDEQHSGVLFAQIVATAHDLGIRAVAEGIETDAQRDAARDRGCDHGQGYRYGSPAEAGDLLTLLVGA
ncbi:EAL domain-containing response regulator [Catenuloplanes indicus]|uniref:EAL domain-containing protein (Putative c-di-GMP-specific phosphodiesterase class I)/FixJ family two-component response regulator n=1 Tax=Catenuloplanes indicus TaxID=137267 RepID=A0AAE3W5C1_9ACTN|nr:EAL domain-containing protein [Catenuloplanes indicus]MDQ0369759.1 EAL domain-containing protein (putative c-di-GMP-specific phosphodiesterase class I)/FixJ family two-component response regulator [Catenuloplanes indicus]